MSYSVKQGNIFGRIGQSAGESLAQSIPKEAERLRLSQGLKELGNKKGLTPWQQFAELSGLAGTTPQIIQSGSELLRQEGIGNALKANAVGEKKPEINFNIKQPRPSESGAGAQSPSLTTREPIEATLKPYIPKTYEQKLAGAGKRLQENPGLYGNDPDRALAAEEAEDQSNINRNNALQGQRANENAVQANLQNGLQNQRKELEADVPGNLYSKIEDKAINAVKPISDGGEGLTEQQALKKYGNELDAASRDYAQVDSVGKRLFFAKSPSEAKRELKQNRENFKKRDDLENLADTYISKNGLSSGKAYYLAYPSSEIKELNNEIVKIPNFGKKYFSENKGQPNASNYEKRRSEDTYKYAPKLAKAMGQDGSPLSIAEELNAKGYDSEAWLKYVGDHRDELNLTERQARELGKSRNRFPTLSDNWLFTLSGLDELVEK